MYAQGNPPIQITSRVPSLIIVCSVGHWSSDSLPLGVKAYCSSPTAEKTSANLDTGMASPLVLGRQSVACNSNILRSQLRYSHEQGDDLVWVRIHEGLDRLEVVGQRASVQ